MSKNVSDSGSKRKNRLNAQNLQPLRIAGRKTIYFRKYVQVVMSAAVKRGALIVFEGCDRSGKTTQVSGGDVMISNIISCIQVKRLVETLNKTDCATEMMR